MILKGKALRRSLRYVLLFVLPLVLFFFVLTLGYEEILEKQAALRLQAEQERATIIISTQVESALAQFVSDLLVVHNSNEIEFYTQNPNEQTLLDLALLFVRITNQKEYILRQRFLDEKGNELIRVNRKPGNFVSISSESELQDVSQSELFIRSRGLAPRVLYISQIKNEGDGNPFITLALPLYQGSRFFGIVALDFSSCYLLSFLSIYQQSLTKDLQFVLIDQKGDVLLRGFDPCVQVYERNENFFTSQPLLNEVLFRAQRNTTRIGKHVYSFQAIFPRTSDRLSSTPGSTRLWTLISYYHDNQLASLSDDFVLSNPILKYILSIILFILGSLFVLLYQLRAGDKQQMRISSVVADYSINGIVVCDSEGKITFCNQVFEKMCGQKQHELIGHPSPRVRKHIEIVPYKGSELPLYPAWILHANQNQFLTTMALRTIYNRHNRIEHTIEIFSPSRYNPQSFIQLTKQAKDEISTCFKAIIPVLDRQRPVACLSFRLQNSKEIGMLLNQGERMLLSQNLCSTLATISTTTLPIYSFAFDSYALFLLDVKPTEAFQTTIENILRYFDNPYQWEYQQYNLKMVCGVSFYPSNAQTLQNLLSNATIAVSMVDVQKNSQRSLFFNEKVKQLYERQDAIRNALPSLFSTNQLKLAYQALLSVSSNHIIGAEALIRWNHPTLGPIRPDEFIPLLKDLGMLDKLGRFVITEAILFLKRNGMILRSLSPSFSLSINLSADELGDPVLIDLLGSLLREHRIADTLLTVELTEFTAVESFSTANSVLEKLHAQGVSIAIDDFGTGFSSLSYLLELSCDKIKIDRSFISRYPDADSITIYKTVLLLAKEVGASVLAEGVENQEQLGFLSLIGCDEYQGYLFSPAVDEAIFLAQVRQTNS